MAQILDLGKIRFNWAGTYVESTEYTYNDLVKYGPNLYAFIAGTAATGSLPTNTANWTLVIEGVSYKGLYTQSTLYFRNDIVIDGTNTYITLIQHTATNPAVAAGNPNLEIIALGQEGLPNQSGNTNKLLATDGTATEWTATPFLTKEYVGNAQGQAALDFENSGELTNTMSVFSSSAADFAQFSIVNSTNSGSASTDFISYTADGNNTDGWIDMGITSRSFDAEAFGITGPHDGYIFMSSPRGETFEVIKKKIVGSIATITTGAAHGYALADVVVVEGIDETFDGKHIITAVTSTTIGFATEASPFSEVNLESLGSVHKPFGNGNLVFATDATGLENAIVFAAGGYDSGSTQMSIIPDDRVHIEIDTESTSSVTGALTVAGGIGLTGNLNIGGDMAVVGQVDFSGVDTLPVGPGAAALALDLTNPTVVAVTDHDNYAQIAHQNLSDAIAASTDIIMYPDNGADGAGFIDMGITSSNFGDPLFTITGKNDGYIFMSAPEGTEGNGDLVFATADTGAQNRIVFAAGGYASNNTQMTIYPDEKVHIEINTPSTSATTGALTVVGGVGITGDVNIAGNITFGGSGTNVSTANLAVNAPLIFTGSGSLVSSNDLGIVTEGKYTVTNIPTVYIVNKQLSTNVATLTTKTAHAFAESDSVTIASIDATFNGTYTITTVPNNTSFTYAKTNVDVASTRIGDQVFSINNKSLAGNIATLQTTATHTYIVGDSVVVTGVDSTFNGTYTITAVTTNTFSYAKTYTNVTSAAVSPVGTATVNTSTATAAVPSATRTRWSALTKKSSDNVWNLVTNISTLPTTTINYSQNTYGNGVDVYYDQAKLGGLTIQGSGSTYGSPYGSLIIDGNISSPAWTTTGIRHVGAAASTLTDTTSTGTVAAAYTNTFGSNVTIAATTSTTYTDYANAYFGNPTAGTNVTMTNKWSVLTAGGIKVGGALNVVGTITGSSTSNIALNTDKFTVNASTGNTIVAGTLDVASTLTATAGLTGGSASNITINTNKFTVAASTGNTVIGGTLAVNSATATLNGGITSSGTVSLTGGVSMSGTVDVQELREQVVDVTLASNVGTLDWSLGNIYYIATAPTAAMTFNVTNVPTDASKIMTINVFVTQAATGYIPTTFQIAGVGQTIRWAGGTAPTATSSAGKIDVFSFSMFRTSGGAWIVYAAPSLNY